MGPGGLCRDSREGSHERGPRHEEGHVPRSDSERWYGAPRVSSAGGSRPRDLPYGCFPQATQRDLRQAARTAAAASAHA